MVSERSCRETREDPIPDEGSIPAGQTGMEGNRSDSDRESYCPIQRLISLHLGRERPPIRASEVLALAREAFEPLYARSPLGPIPEYLQSHWRVFGCVAEYEENLEQLDQWKVEQLDRWLQEHVGRRWRSDGRLYELSVVAGAGPDAPAYIVKFLED